MCEVGPPPALPSQDPAKLKKAPSWSNVPGCLVLRCDEAQLQKEEEEAAKRKTELEAQREDSCQGWKAVPSPCSCRSWIESG